MAGGLDELAVQLADVAARLREAAGTEGMPRQLSNAIGRAVDPAKDHLDAAVEEDFPRRGGYAAVIRAELDVYRRSSSSPDGVEVTVYARTNGEAKRKMQQRDDGILWHPLFGRYPRLDPRNRWFEQSMTPGWFSKTMDDLSPSIREAIAAALDEVLAKAAGK